jgi:predicted nucleotidyltransferase
MHKSGLDLLALNKIRSVFSRYPQIIDVVLYGSRAKGNYREGSDIDLTIHAPALSTNELLKITNELDDLMLPYKFDLSLYHQIEDPDFIEHIQRVGFSFIKEK